MTDDQAILLFDDDPTVRLLNHNALAAFLYPLFALAL
jgi:hypothetical protein